MSKKVVINACFGGFGLSDDAEALVEKRTGEVFFSSSHPRHCPVLVSVVEELGVNANGTSAVLHVVELRGDRYIISEYDGAECVQEPDDIKWVEVQS